MLGKKTFRDIKFNKSQFFTIFLMVFLGVYAFSGLHSYMDGMTVSGDAFYEENNFQDLWLVGENFTKEDLDKVKSLENIQDAERILTITTVLENFDDVTLETNFIETNNISKMYVIEGEGFKPGEKGIWLDSYLAKNLGLKVGDEITLSYQKYKITEKIKGLVNTPDHIYSIKNESKIFPTHDDFGYVYLSIDEFPQEYIIDEVKAKIAKESGMAKENVTEDVIKNLMPDFDVKASYMFNNIIVDVQDTEKLKETKVSVEDNIESAIAVTDRETNISHKMYHSEIEEGQTYSVVFTALFLFIAVLSVVTTMNRFVKKQRTQIGTLKALGFKNSKIIRHYISYGFFVSAIASVLGMILGKYTLGVMFMSMEMSYFEVPKYSAVLKPIVYELAVVVVLVITAITYLSCRKVLKEPASQALRTEIPKVKNTKFDLTTKGKFKNSSLSTRWNLRDISRNKGRTIMGIVGVVGCTMLIVCAFGMLDTMNSYLDWQFDKLFNFQYKLELKNGYSEDQFEKLTADYGNATSQDLGIEVKKSDGSKETNTVTINDAKEHLKYTGHNMEYIDLKDDGVFITEKLSNKLGLKVGDEITWRAYGDDTWYTTKIAGLNRDPQSQSLNMSRKYAEEIGLEYKPDAIYTNEDLSKIDELDGVEAIQSITSIKKGMSSMLEVMKSIIVMLIVVSVILGCVIIYNLGILSFSEKQYQFATLKVLGFKNAQIKKIFIKQNIWITIVAIIIGLPLGYLMTDFTFKSALGENFDFITEIGVLSYLYAIVGTLIVSIFVNKKLSNKVKTIDMVTSLKANE